jgi:hypothetical protein
LVSLLFFWPLHSAMTNVDQFEWADGNPNHEDREHMSVRLVGNKIEPAYHDTGNIYADMPGSDRDDAIVGVVIFPMDKDHRWATIQLTGRVMIRKECAKRSYWTKMQENARGPLDEYFIG